MEVRGEGGSAIVGVRILGIEAFAGPAFGFEEAGSWGGLVGGFVVLGFGLRGLGRRRLGGGLGWGVFVGHAFEHLGPEAGAALSLGLFVHLDGPEPLNFGGLGSLFGAGEGATGGPGLVGGLVGGGLGGGGRGRMGGIGGVATVGGDSEGRECGGGPGASGKSNGVGLLAQGGDHLARKEAIPGDPARGDIQ